MRTGRAMQPSASQSMHSGAGGGSVPPSQPGTVPGSPSMSLGGGTTTRPHVRHPSRSPLDADQEQDSDEKFHIFMLHMSPCCWLLIMITSIHVPLLLAAHHDHLDPTSVSQVTFQGAPSMSLVYHEPESRAAFEWAPPPPSSYNGMGPGSALGRENRYGSYRRIEFTV